jgi:hypothetical protein
MKAFLAATELQTKWELLQFNVRTLPNTHPQDGRADFIILANFMMNVLKISPQKIAKIGTLSLLFLLFAMMPMGVDNNSGTKMNLHTVKCFTKSIVYGSKYIYQTVPRLLTIWLDMGENITPAIADVFKKLNHSVAHAIKTAPVYKVGQPSDSCLTCLLFLSSGLPLSLKLSLASAIKTTRSTQSYPH